MVSDEDSETKRLRICFVCDFFYPNTGGVETHIYQIAQCLIRRGHHVIVVTHAYGDKFVGTHLFPAPKLKVYYIPQWIVGAQAALPTLYTLLPIYRRIWLAEGIQIVHGHQASSTMANTAMLHARTMGLKTCFTDHSLFPFADLGSIANNKVFRFCTAGIDQMIAVSDAGKENTFLRTSFPADKITVIPNAVVSARFQPATEMPTRPITIVVIARLVYRKGIDLLLPVIPALCRAHPTLRFVIAGDGPKRLALEQMREKHLLHDRVDLIGSIPHTKVREVLLQGDIFLNTSLTEAFCIAILEAASCGLLVVSTDVGGITEVLPDDMVLYSPAEANALVDHCSKAIAQHAKYQKEWPERPWACHQRVKAMYTWDRVAAETEKVYYTKLMDAETAAYQKTLLWRLEEYYSIGSWAGKIYCCVILLEVFLDWVLTYLQPVEATWQSPRIVANKSK